MALVPLVMVVMNVVYSLAAYPAGILTDGTGRSGVLGLGIGFLIVVDLILAFGTTIPLTLLGVACWGLHMGFTQGIFAALVADTAPVDLRGSAFGLYNLVIGVRRHARRKRHCRRAVGGSRPERHVPRRSGLQRDRLFRTSAYRNGSAAEPDPQTSYLKALAPDSRGVRRAHRSRGTCCHGPRTPW